MRGLYIRKFYKIHRDRSEESADTVVPVLPPVCLVAATQRHHFHHRFDAPSGSAAGQVIAANRAP